APNKPSRLWVCVAPVAVSHDGSADEYDSRLSETAKPSRSNRIPTASLSRVCRDGERNVIRRCGRKLPERPLLCQKPCGTRRTPPNCYASEISERKR